MTHHKHLSHFITYHKAVLDSYRSDVKTNTLIKTEGKYISYKQLYKGDEELFATKVFLILWLNNSGMLD